MINHKLLCLLEGKCWHEWDWKPKDGDIHIYECAKCGLRVGGMPQRNDYSSTNTYMPFLQWFWEERKGMWEAFDWWTVPIWNKESRNTKIFWTPWLFSLTDEGEPRIMVLLSEWLALPEVKEKWGWEECEACGGQGFYCIGNPNDEETWCCEKCDGRCKVKAEWAKEV